MLPDLPPRFVDLFRDNLAPITEAVAHAVSESFTASGAPMRGDVPAAEVKRRTEMAAAIAVVLRGDLTWSVPRIRDHLTAYLRMSLLGIAYTPASTDHGWVAPSRC